MDAVTKNLSTQMIYLKSIFKFWKDKDGKKSISVPKDPVCGMRPAEDINFVYEGIGYSFCSDYCRQRFAKSPVAYIAK